MELLEGKMEGAPNPETVSTKLQKIAELARKASAMVLHGHLRSFLGQRVRDGVISSLYLRSKTMI
jgi:hypothetical protein